MHLRRPIALSALLTLAACQAAAPRGPAPPSGADAGLVRAADLAGTRWIVTHVEGRLVVPRTEPTLDVEADRAHAFGGCNGFGGRFHPDRAFGLDGPIITLAGCAEPLGAQEDRYFQAFVDIDRARLEGDRLALLDAAGRERVRLVRRPPPPGPPGPLAGTRWRLATLDGVAVPAATRGWLAFDDGRRYRMREGCRYSQGTYVLGSDRFELRWLHADESACRDPEASSDDQRRMGVTRHVVQHGLVAGQLHVIGRNGHRAVFERCDACRIGDVP